jgi:1-deoxy-D-xylulose-5-phosphate synthase
MKLLDDKLFPDTLKALSYEELADLAAEIREVIITTVSRNGGHLASNLGIVELAISMHKVFHMPEDKFIWDVGHQCYPHKILTGRLQRFHTLRQFGGISGFPKSSESCFDCFDAGHSGTSISAALGMAVQRDLAGRDHKVIAVIGDASLTNGMALEAMNNAGYMGTDIIIVLNDNERSISRNVGSYSKYLNKLRMELTYPRSKGRTKRIPDSGRTDKRLFNGAMKQFTDRVRHALTPSRTGAVFQELGFMYFGPVDGHRIDSLCEIFESIKELKGPVLVHAVTCKGKGYKYSEENATKFHGIGSFNCMTGEAEEKEKKPSYTSIFGKTATDLARKDPNIVAITAAMTDGTGLRGFKKEFPSRFFDVGIAEEHAVTFAAGLAKSGAKPLVVIYSTFLQRTYDQILHDVCLQKLPVKFMIDRGGLVGEDGPTHHGVFDLSYLRNIPNMVIMAPKDENEFRHMIKTAVEYNDGPIAVRYPRGEAFGVALDPDLNTLPIGRSELLREGRTVAILTLGSTVYPSLEAAEILTRRGLNPSVINARFAKPLDGDMLEKVVTEYSFLITVEENVLAGGFGSAVVEHLSDREVPRVTVKRIGLPDSFVEHGSQVILREKYGLSPERIAETIEEFLHKTPVDGGGLNQSA